MTPTPTYIASRWSQSELGSLEVTHIDSSLDPAASSARLDLICEIAQIRVHFFCSLFCVVACSLFLCV